jgi:hypothetical protein
VLLPASTAAAQSPPADDLQTVLSSAREALGLQHAANLQALRYRGVIETEGLRGNVDAWIYRSGGAEATYTALPPLSQDAGYDGRVAWTRDAKGVVVVDGSVAGRAAAINALYRDTYALWTPNFGGAHVDFVGTRIDGGTTYDVVRVAPAQSAVPFEYWFDVGTHLPTRVVEMIPPVTTTTILSRYERTAAGLLFPRLQNSTDSEGNVTSLAVDRVDINSDATAVHVRKPVSSPHDFTIVGGTETNVPFTLVDNHVYLDVMLNGTGPYRFEFDTGGQNVIDPSVARALSAAVTGSLQGGGVGANSEQVRFARVRSLRIGQAELRDQIFAVLPVRGAISDAKSAPVDGFIGFEVLARFVTTFDYQAGRVTLSMPGAMTVPGKPITFVFSGTQPQIPCKIDGVETACTVDTGSRSSVDLFSPFIAAHPSVVPANTTAPGMNGFGVGGGSVGRLGRLRSLEMGGYDLNNLIAGFSVTNRGGFAAIGLGANVGGSVWKRFRLTFNYKAERMWLDPNASFNEPDHYDRSGMFVIARKGQVSVVDVRPGTPAATAGIKNGDTIVSVDGKASVELTLATVRTAFRGRPGTVILIRVATGNDAPRDIRLTLNDYV